MLDWIADTLFNRSQRRLYETLRTQKPLFWHPIMPYGFLYRHQIIGSEASPGRGRYCAFVIDEAGVTLYPQSQKMDIRLDFARANLRWFGRPSKYQDGVNELWLHLEQDNRWHLIQLRSTKYYMQQAVRALKKIATPEQLKAYRRHRPYIHAGPVSASPAEQDLYGVWTVQPQPVQLYLMPLALVLLDHTSRQVQRVLPLEQIQQIEALRRVDALPGTPLTEGVVRFKLMPQPGTADSTPETCAYVLSDYVTFGEALAEAAKRTLEDPFVALKKKHDKYDDFDDDDD